MVVLFLVGTEGLSASLSVCSRFAQRKLVSGAARPLKRYRCGVFLRGCVRNYES